MHISRKDIQNSEEGNLSSELSLEQGALSYRPWGVCSKKFIGDRMSAAKLQPWCWDQHEILTQNTDPRF
jgi:hypothetical protein